MFMLRITGSLYFFEGRTELKFHFIKKGSAKGITQVIIVEMVYVTPKAVITITAF